MGFFVKSILLRILNISVCTCQVLRGRPGEHDHPCMVVNMQKCYMAVFLPEYEEYLRETQHNEKNIIFDDFSFQRRNRKAYNSTNNEYCLIIHYLTEIFNASC